MITYFLSLGSNIEPRKNMVRILEELLSLSPVIKLSRIIETIPIGLDSKNMFLNASASIQSELAQENLKEKFSAIETKLGRDRTNANRKVKDRTADIDILFSLTDHTVRETDLPTQEYVAPTLRELLRYLNYDVTPLPLTDGVELRLHGQKIGARAVTLRTTNPDSFQVFTE